MTAELPPALPDEPLDEPLILQTLAALRESDVPTKGGRTTSYVYDSGREDLDTFGQRAFAISEHVNGLDPTAFPSFAAVENDLVAAALQLLGSGSADEVGSLTSGGTESCALAVLAARERWRKKAGEPHGRASIIVPDSVHPAFLKAAHLFDLDIVRVPVDPVTFAADPAGTAAAMNARTALVVVSAPSYPYGVVDPVAEIAAIAAEGDVLCHVDACIGGWTLPYIRAAEGLTPIGLMVPGVTSVSVDLHKYAYAPKGASVVLFRDAQLRRHAWFVTSDWAGYPVVNPTLLSTRAGGPPAIAWAYLKKISSSGYRDLALSAWRATRAILDGIRVVGDVASTIFAFADDGDPAGPDIRVILDEMAERGWLLGAQPAFAGGPATAHMCVMAVHEPQVDTFLADLADSVAAARPQGRVEVDPGLLEVARQIDPATLTPEAMDLVLAAAGIDLSAGGLPVRRAQINAIIEQAPPRLVEELLAEVLGRILRPSPQS
jgi:sphinganine-1-phosphate aldolase